MVFSKSLDKMADLEREYREFTNGANKLKEICEIRLFAVFALGILRL